MTSLCTGVRAGVLCVVMMVTTAAAFHPPARLPHDLHHGNTRSEFPCPEIEDIKPCKCNYTGQNMTLSCIALSDAAQLDQVFSATFPIPLFSKFTLMASNIPILKKDTFKKVSFREVQMFSNKMKTVEAEAFAASYSTLKKFMFNEDGLVNQSWPLPDLKNFSEITDIYVGGLCKEIPPLESSSLTSAAFYMDNLTKLASNTFAKTPNLENIILHGKELTDIEPNAFQQLSSLKTLTIYETGVDTLNKSSMAFSSTVLTLIDLHHNKIQTIEEGAFQDVSGEVNITLNNNQLQLLNEDPFSELLTNTTGIIDVSDNPLECGCDLYWTVTITEEMFDHLHGLLSSCNFEEVRALAFPCPDENEIDPCRCDYDPVSGTLNLTCSQLDSIDQLDKVFSANFPFNKFNLFQLEDSKIPVLKKGIFRSVYFKWVILIFNNMTDVESGALESLYDSLEEFHITEKYVDEDYNWPIQDLSKFKVLSEIGISGPYSSLPVLESKSLNSVLLDMYHLTSLPDNIFTAAPNLQSITFQGTRLEDIKADTFKFLPSLRTLEIRNANLSSLAKSSLAFSTNNLTYIGLQFNNIHTVEDGAFQGINGPVVTDLSNNEIEELPGDAFADLLKNTTGSISVTNNPLVCGCDLSWLINATDAELKRLVGLQSSCGIDDPYQWEVVKDFLIYQCS
ncbi:leucine-rich repeat-containing G-protein coupled receptor 4-like [Homarus americanus]|uniref:leucine-rich repeat-containing G-protein coupled receptor 4-like n=1 Tax=Homarus americanus TaxID=6706 RepID=UPI001C447B12|nr:leucine-rich repeat-containing G-protein coupled receptor 4-like [Homarus americanus]